MTRNRAQEPSQDAEGESFRFDVRCPGLTPARAWAAVVDLRRHGDVVPLTTIDAPAIDELEVGSRIVARTALGSFGFDDVMIVRELDPERRVVFDKVGAALGGRVIVGIQPMMARETVAPKPASSREQGAVIHWSQRVDLPWLPDAVSRALVRVAAPVVGRGYSQVVTRLVACVTADSGSS